MSDDAGREPDAGEGEALDADAESLEEFLAQFPGSAYQYVLFRWEPRQASIGGKVVKTDGHLDTLHTAPTIDSVKQTWGGGTFEIRVQRSNPGARTSRWVKSRRFEIAGPPKLARELELETTPTPVAAPAAPPSPESPQLVSRVLEHSFEDKRRLEDRLERERQRAYDDRAKAERQQSSPAPELIKTALESVQRSAEAQLASYREQVNRAYQELGDMRRQVETLRPSSPLENPEVLKALFGRNHEDSQRLHESHRGELANERDRAVRELQAARELYLREAQIERERHARELAAERERVQREVTTERERAIREIDAERREHSKAVELLDRLHRTEVDNLRAVHASELQHLRTAQEQLAQSKESEAARLGEELRALRQTTRPNDPVGEIERMAKVVDAVKSLLPESGGGEPAVPLPSMSDQLIASFAHKAPDLVQTLLGSLGSVGGSPPSPVSLQGLERLLPMLSATTPTAPTMPPPALPHPAVYATAPHREVPASPVSTIQRARPSAAPPPPIQKAAAVPATQVVATAAAPADQVKAVQFLETALQNGHAPTEVARATLSLFPKADVAALMALGVPALHTAAREAAPDSDLAGPAGPRFLEALFPALEAELAART